MVDYMTNIILTIPRLDKGNGTEAETNAGEIGGRGRELARLYNRIAVMMSVLEDQGFVFSRRGDRIIGSSQAMETQELKELLQEHGFADNEYQVYLEYQRKWGIM